MGAQVMPLHTAPWMTLAGLTLGAVLEEIVFRHGLLKGLLTQPALSRARAWTAGLSGANWLSSALFALAHGVHRSWWLAAGVLPFSLGLGWLYERHGDWRVCAAVHSVLNGVWWWLSPTWVLPHLMDGA